MEIQNGRKNASSDDWTASMSDCGIGHMEAKEDHRIIRNALNFPCVQKNGMTYGATKNSIGPIGGGLGYTQVFNTGDYIVTDADALIEALRIAKSGEVVYIPNEVVIDLTERIAIENLVLCINEGVTLASSRGRHGALGGLIYSGFYDTEPMICTNGPDVRISGLRVCGPDPQRRLEHHRRCFREGRGHEYYYRFPMSTGIVTEHPRLTVDNCECSGWSKRAVGLRYGSGHVVRHNYIHHNQLQGLGYGVSMSRSYALIEYNLFNRNRHSIAGSGNADSGYEARHNIEAGISLSHCFDMHGGKDRKDGTDIAGDTIDIHHNTFLSSQRPVHIRGNPVRYAKITQNLIVSHSLPMRMESDTIHIEDNLTVDYERIADPDHKNS